VTDRSCTILATSVGATIGALAGYILFTDRGRMLRRELEPALEQLTHELNNFRGTVQRAVGVAHEGWKLLNDAVGESSPPPHARYADPHQTTPF
jgi:hypothetical protein